MPDSKSPEPGRQVITYPTGWLLAVIDDPAEAARAAEALHASGLAADRVRVLTGAAGRTGLSELGPRRTPLSRITRAVQFMTMDQMPDFAWYEAALDEGRALIAVQVSRRAEIVAARAVLARHGSHFENHFGRFMTEEFSRWRGREPDLPSTLRR
jgi:hypothetical protein